MNNKIKLAVVPFLLALGACSSSSSTAPAGGGASLEIITVSGNFMALDGTYNICYARTDPGIASTLDEVIISGSSFSMTSQDYSLAGCSAPIDGTSSAAQATISTTGTTAALTDWVDGQQNSVAPPVAVDGSALPANAEYTVMSVTISGTPTGNFSGIPVGTPITIFYVVDDTGTSTGAAPVLYRDDDADGGVASTADPLTKAP